MADSRVAVGRFPGRLVRGPVVTMIRETGPAMQKLKMRRDRTPVALRKLAKAEPDARVARRLLAIANALGGMNRAEAAASAMYRPTSTPPSNPAPKMRSP